MTANLFKRIEFMANIAIIVVAILICFVLFKRYYADSTESSQPIIAIQTGTTISLPDVNWSAKQRTLLLVLSPGCRFCSESAPFYKRLVQETADRNNIQLIAVSPATVTETEQYLNELGINPGEIKQASLNSINVRGTPALILIDDKGIVLNSWIGQLSPAMESEVLTSMRCGNCDSYNQH